MSVYFVFKQSELLPVEQAHKKPAVWDAWRENRTAVCDASTGDVLYPSRILTKPQKSTDTEPVLGPYAKTVVFSRAGERRSIEDIKAQMEDMKLSMLERENVAKGYKKRYGASLK